MNDFTSFPLYNVLEIIKGTTVDGPGFRTSIYLAGCNHHCIGCQNPQSWDPENGKLMSLQDILNVVNEEDFDVTLSGGDPLFNPLKLKILVHELKKNRRNVWIYTGYTWEEIMANPDYFASVKEADIVVDGRYLQEKRDLDLPFRGSSNQRLINVQKTIETGKIVCLLR